MKKTCIVLVGAPCSGKSTIGKLTALKMNIGYISSGDIAREMAKTDMQIDNTLSSGGMAPEDKMRSAIYNKLWYSLIKKDRDTVILDGFPRFGDQAEWLYDILPHNIGIKYVLFDVRLQVIIERSDKRNRSDDKSLLQRLKYYYDITYKDLSKYVDITIDANEDAVDKCSELLINYIKEVSNG